MWVLRAYQMYINRKERCTLWCNSPVTYRSDRSVLLSSTSESLNELLAKWFVRMVRLSSCLCPAICFRADCQWAVFPPRLNMQKRVSRCFVTVCAKCWTWPWVVPAQFIEQSKETDCPNMMTGRDLLLWVSVSTYLLNKAVGGHFLKLKQWLHRVLVTLFFLMLYIWYNYWRSI